MILVTTYQDPDLDGTACSVAEAEFLVEQGEEAVAGVFGTLHREAIACIQTFGLDWPMNAMEVIDQVDEIVLTDTSDTHGLSPLIDPNKVTVVIDHRKDSNPDDFPNADRQIELVGSAATLVTEHFINAGLIPSRTSAYLLAGAIVSNTVNFQNMVTHPRDRAAYLWLKRQEQLPENFVDVLFASKSTFTDENLFEEIEHDSAWFQMGEKKIGIAQLEIVHAQEFLEDFTALVFPVLQTLQTQKALDHGFLSIVDIDRGRTIFLTNDNQMKMVLTQTLDVEWVGDQAIKNGIIMRKEIVPLLREIIV
ncbi:DHH family phosphoesterase [Candidatus Uhrbacteria bacterium]|nr:DHH family phosphoesterase [Candidatus Uhrbacteria bacterium]